MLLMDNLMTLLLGEIELQVCPKFLMFSHGCLCGSLISLVFHDCRKDLRQLRCDHQYLPSVSLAIEKISSWSHRPDSHHPSSALPAPLRCQLQKKKMTVTWKHKVNYQRRRRSAVSSNFTLYIAKNLQCVCAQCGDLPPASSRNSTFLPSDSLQVDSEQCPPPLRVLPLPVILLILSGCNPTATKLWSFALYLVNA